MLCRYASLHFALTLVIPAAAQAESPIPASIDLRDGSRLIGHVAHQEYSFVGEDGSRMSISTKNSIGFDIDDDRELSTLYLADGRIRGVVEWKQMEINGLLGTVKVSIDHIKSVQFLQTELGLISHYKFDGNCKDSSGNENHGQPHGDVKFIKLENGQAASFDGNGDYISVEPKSDVSQVQDFTIAARVFLSNWKAGNRRFGNDFQYIFDGFSEPNRQVFFSNGFGLLCHTDFKNEHLYGYLFVDEANSHRHKPPVPLSGLWRHVVLSRSADRECLYVDGDIVSSLPDQTEGRTNQPLNMKHTWYIGTFGANNPNYIGVKQGFRYDLNGHIDDLRIYNRALHAHEVRHLADDTLQDKISLRQ